MLPEADPIVVTGLGAVSAAGRGADALWRACVSGEHLYRPTEHAVDGQAAEPFSALIAPVPQGAELEALSPEGLRTLRRYDRNCAFTLAAITEAMAMAGVAADRTDMTKVGVIWGSGASSVQMTQHSFEELLLRRKKRLNPLSVAQTMVSAPCSVAALLLGAGGLSFSVGSACASSAHALYLGANLVAQGVLDHAIVGGSEQLNTYGAIAAWASSPVLSKTGCWPLQPQRDGTVLGEGAGALVLQRESMACAQGRPVLAKLRAAGVSTGGEDIVSPKREPIRRLFSTLPLEPMRGRRVLVNVHGTATSVGDEVEADILGEVIGRHGLDARISATKPVTGHTLSASGGLEAVISVLSLHNALAPGERPRGTLINSLAPARSEEAFQPEFAVSNSFGFGGMNCVLVFERA